MNYADKAFDKAKYYKYERTTNRGENKSRKDRIVREHYTVHESGMRNLAEAILKSAIVDVQDNSLRLKADVRDFAMGKEKNWCRTLCQISHIDYNAYKERVRELL